MQHRRHDCRSVMVHLALSTRALPKPLDPMVSHPKRASTTGHWTTTNRQQEWTPTSSRNAPNHHPSGSNRTGPTYGWRRCCSSCYQALAIFQAAQPARRLLELQQNHQERFDAASVKLNITNYPKADRKLFARFLAAAAGLTQWSGHLAEALVA